VTTAISSQAQISGAGIRTFGPARVNGDEAIRRPRIACVIDADNIWVHGNKPRASRFVLRLVEALEQRGIQRGTVCRNVFSESELALWQPTRFEPRAANCNCDPFVVHAAIAYLQGGLDWLILVGGDGDYVPLVKAAQAAGASVEVWTRRSTASHALMKTADRVCFVEDIVRGDECRPIGIEPVHAHAVRHAA
jgi:hypothetical protein